jgi:hypothetical protein
MSIYGISAHTRVLPTSRMRTSDCRAELGRTGVDARPHMAVITAVVLQ